MTKRELIELLETHSDEKPVWIEDDLADKGARPITGVDSYEDVLILTVRDKEEE